MWLCKSRWRHVSLEEWTTSSVAAFREKSSSSLFEELSEYVGLGLLEKQEKSLITSIFFYLVCNSFNTWILLLCVVPVWVGKDSSVFDSGEHHGRWRPSWQCNQVLEETQEDVAQSPSFQLPLCSIRYVIWNFYYYLCDFTKALKEKEYWIVMQLKSVCFHFHQVTADQHQKHASIPMASKQ